MRRENLRVKIDGEVRIGTELMLLRDLPVPEQPNGIRVRPSAPEWIRVSQGTVPDDPGGAGIREDRYVYSLRPAEESIRIVNQGLCQSYGIFGNPGVGKTYLLMYLLRQILQHAADKPERKFGGIILDPKAALMGDVAEAFRAAGREKDLIIINESLMTEESREVNVIDCFLSPYNLGKALAVAAQSAGISSKEPYWLNELGTIFGAGLQLLELMQSQPYFYSRPTLRNLVDLLLSERDVGTEDEPKYRPVLDIVLEHAALCGRSFNEIDREELGICRSTLQRFRQSKDYGVLSSFIEQCYGQFRRRPYALFSQKIAPGSFERSIFDAAIEDGKFILVSVSKSSLSISKMLCTLVKTIFQQTVLTRLDRHYAGQLENFIRPLLFMADEYSDVATELPGSPMGDALFFSQMRQFGCMALVATQSVQMLKAAGLEETWKAIYGNMAAKIFMQTGDPETAEEATKLVGESEFRFRNTTRTWSADGTNRSENNDLKDRKDLPTKILLQTLGMGQAVIVGNTDGKSRPGTWFVQIDPPHSMSGNS